MLKKRRILPPKCCRLQGRSYARGDIGDDDLVAKLSKPQRKILGYGSSLLAFFCCVYISFLLVISIILALTTTHIFHTLERNEETFCLCRRYKDMMRKARLPLEVSINKSYTHRHWHILFGSVFLFFICIQS